MREQAPSFQCLGTLVTRSQRRAAGGRAAIRMAKRISRVQGEWVMAWQLEPLSAIPNPPSQYPTKPCFTNNTYRTGFSNCRYLTPPFEGQSQKKEWHLIRSLCSCIPDAAVPNVDPHGKSLHLVYEVRGLVLDAFGLSKSIGIETSRLKQHHNRPTPRPAHPDG